MPGDFKKSKLKMFGLQKILKREWLFEKENGSGYINGSTAGNCYPRGN